MWDGKWASFGGAVNRARINNTAIQCQERGDGEEGGGLKGRCWVGQEERRRQLSPACLEWEVMGSKLHLSLSHFPPPFVIPPPSSPIISSAPSLTRSISLCEYWLFWKFNWLAIPNVSRWDGEKWRATKRPSQGRLCCCHGHRFPFEKCAGSTSPWHAQCGGWSLSCTVHHVLCMKAKPLPVNPRSMLGYCSLDLLIGCS